MTTNDEASYSWPLLIEAQAQAVRASQPPLLSELVEPVALFAKLVREVEAGQALIALAMTDREQRAAALDALALTRDVLDDARAQLVAAGFPVEDGSSGGRPPSPECSHCPPDCKSCWAPDCECYAHQNEPDRRGQAPGAARKISGDDPAGFVTSRTSCACGAAVEVDDDEIVLLLDGSELAHGRTACLHAGHWSGQHDGCDRSVCDQAVQP